MGAVFYLIYTKGLMVLPGLYSLYNSGKSLYNSLQPKYQGPINKGYSENYFRQTGKEGGQVLGANTTSGGGGSLGGGGSSGGGGGYSPGGITQQILSGAYDQSVPAFQEPDYDAMIAPALQKLDEAIAPAQGQYEGNVASIDAQRQRGISGQQSALEEARNAAAAARTRNEQTTEGAVNEQRRGFSEIQQGLQSRYGGTTGTGRFAAEIAGSRSLGNIAAQRQNLSNVITDIDNNFEKVRGMAQIAIQDIEDNTADQKRQAKTQLDQSLNQIRLAKGELMGKKAELASQAIQFYQQAVAKVNSDNTAFKQRLALQQSAAEQRLTEARNRATTAGRSNDSFNVQVIGQRPGSDLFGTPTPVYGRVGSKSGQIQAIDPSQLGSYGESQMGGEQIPDDYSYNTDEDLYGSLFGQQ